MPIITGRHDVSGKRPAADLLGDEEDHLAAVERRDRQEVEHGQVDAQDPQEVEERLQSPDLAIR